MEKVQRIAVIGAGVMGRGIAYAAALGGFDVTIQDINEEQLSNAISSISKNLTKGVALGKLTATNQTDALSRIKTTTELELAASDADLAIEAILEIMELKIDVFKKLDILCPPNTILATNTSTMSPTEIGAATNRADRTIAMHFFNPVQKMKLVEIVRGLDTSDETYAIVNEIAVQMGKETVELNDFPGFVTSRISCLIGNEAMHLLQEGVGSAKDIDKAIKLGLNYPMGPLELADLVGLDSRLRNMQYLHEKLGDHYRPAPILEKYVKSGRLGRKSGRGFYDYTDK